MDSARRPTPAPGRGPAAEGPRAAPTVVVVGATGLVGESLLRVLEERAFPVGELRLLASERSSRTRLSFHGRSLPVEPAGPELLEGSDLAFFAATGELSRTLAPEAARLGAIAIDKSSTWRLDPRVPLVVPEINPDALDLHEGIVACPNCTTIGVALVLEPLRRLAGLVRVGGTTLQAASGAGRSGLEELERQEADRRTGQRSEPAVFPRVLARNAVPQCDALGAGGWTGEEEKLRLETRKILALPALEVEMTCVRVPVAVGHGAALWVETARAVALDEVLEALESFPGLRLVREGPPPTALEAEGTDEVWVGRVRVSEDRRRVLLWLVADNLRKGAATNAVQIAERLLAPARTGRQPATG